MNRMNIRLSFLFLMLPAVFSLVSCSSEQTRTTPSPETVRNIPVLAVQQANVPDLLEAVGTVRAAQTSDAASQMTGNIVEIRAHEGDHVQRGQVLAVIDDSQPRAAVDRSTAADLAAQQQLVGADSDLALAESTLKRYQNLYEKKSVSPQEFDEVKARQQGALARRDMAKAGQAQAQAALSQARTSLDYTRIRAPFDGVVTEKKADPGTLASPGMPIFTIEDVRHYRLEATVNENDLQYVRTGEQVSVVIDALDNANLKGKGRKANLFQPADAASRNSVPGEDRFADRLTSTLGAVRASPVFPGRAAGAVDSALGGRRTWPIARHLCAGPKQGCEFALHHIGKAFRCRGRSARRPPGRRAARDQTGCSGPEWQTH